MNGSLEHTLAFHCAPALAGIKPSNLICCDLTRYPSLDRELHALNRQLNPHGLFFRPVCRCSGRVLLLVYRRALLERHLAQPDARAFLKRAGYPSGGLEATLVHFQTRLAHTDSFPHEAGVILGYPLADVEGFLRDGGKNYKFSGYWKVYDNEEETRALFVRFNRCREALCRRVAAGKSIAQLFSAA